MLTTYWLKIIFIQPYVLLLINHFSIHFFQLEYSMQVSANFFLKKHNDVFIPCFPAANRMHGT